MSYERTEAVKPFSFHGENMTVRFSAHKVKYEKRYRPNHGALDIESDKYFFTFDVFIIYWALWKSRRSLTPKFNIMSIQVCITRRQYYRTFSLEVDYGTVDVLKNTCNFENINIGLQQLKEVRAKHCWLNFLRVRNFWTWRIAISDDTCSREVIL